MGTNTFIGIDPGKTGALCILYKDEPFFVDWPKDDSLLSLINDVNDVVYTIHDTFEVYDTFESFVDNTNLFCIIEQQSSRPLQGAPATFKSGMNYGMWLMFLAMYKVPHRIIHPNTIFKGIVPVVAKKSKMKAAERKKLQKKENYKTACRLFPRDAHLLTGTRRGIKDGRADALLMAYKAKLIETKGE